MRLIDFMYTTLKLFVVCIFVKAANLFRINSQKILMLFQYYMYDDVRVHEMVNVQKS